MTKQEARYYLIDAIRNSESYEVYEKCDGSLGILMLDPEDNEYKFATRGSFDSEQAKKATSIFNSDETRVKSISRKYLELLTVNESYKDYTLLFEIIYPENRFNDGARLVCDYGNNEKLVLLAGINKFNKQELDRTTLEQIAYYIETDICKKYDYTIEDLVKMKETLPVTEEGWVVKFKPSNFRVKIKGDEYCKLQKILNSISPLSIYEKMMDSQDFRLTKEYLSLIPEEIRPEVIELEEKLFANYLKYLQQAVLEMRQFHCNADLDGSIKSLALDIKNTNNYMLPSGIYFAMFNRDLDRAKNIIRKYVRPRANEI